MRFNIQLTIDNDYQGKLIIPSNADSIPTEILIILSIVDGTQLGDINNDGNINVLDAIAVVTLVLNGEYNEIVDMNFDGLVNILDIIEIIYIIIN